MIIQFPPLPVYDHVRDHLEQALAITPRDDHHAQLRLKIEEAIEVAIELSHKSARIQSSE